MDSGSEEVCVARMSLPFEEVVVNPELDVVAQIQEVLQEFQEVFAGSFKDMVQAPMAQSRIDLKPGSMPKKVGGRMRRYAPTELAFIKEQIELLTNVGFLEHVQVFEWLSPIVLAPKKGSDKLRLCVAYCALNNATLEDHYPLPRCDDLLDRLAGYRFTVQ